MDQLHHRGWHYCLLAGICAFLYFLNLGGATLWDLDEGRNAGCSLEMLEANNWIVPTFNGELRVHKPVLLYWLQMWSYKWFGVNEFAARLPSALAALFTVLLAYELARSMFTRSTGLLAGVIAASTPMTCAAARFANPDALLNFFTVLTLTIFWLGLPGRRWWWFLLLGVASGLAVLAKGPVGLVLPGAVTTLFLLWQGRLWLLWDRGMIIAFWSFVLTAVPWYVLVGLETHGEFLSEFFWTHNLSRGLSTMENHGGFPGYYLIVLVIGTAPWSIFIFLACWFGFWSTIRVPWLSCQTWWASASEVGTQESDDSLSDPPAAYRLLICWILVYLVAFSVAATKLPNYVLPAVVPAMVLVARFLQRWRTETLQIPNWTVYTGAVCLLLIGVIFSGGLAIVGGVGDFAMMRGRFITGLADWAILGAIPILAGILCVWFAWQRQPGRFVGTVGVCATLLLGPMAAFGTAVFNDQKAPQALVEQTRASRQTQDIRIGCWNLEYLPSLNFYLGRNVEHLRDLNSLENFLRCRLQVYVFIPLADWHEMETKIEPFTRIVARRHDMYHNTDVIVLTNR